MAAALPDEASDLVTCPVCLCEYDDVDDGRKPKFLPCSHTLCLKCLKTIKGTISLICPLCRKVCSHSGDVSLFPNNQYAICILKMNKGKEKDTPQAPSNSTSLTNKLIWCLACKSMASSDCTSHHSTVDMSTETLTNFEALLSLKESFCQMRDPVRSKVAEAVLAKMEVRSYLEQVTGALKAAQMGVDELKEENDVMVAEMSSLMESGVLAHFQSTKEENEAFLTLMRQLLEGSPSSDPLKTVQDKMKESFQDVERKVDSIATHSAGKIAAQVKKTHISIQLLDHETGTPLAGQMALLADGFVVKWLGVKGKQTANLKDLLLISHVILSLMDRNGIKESPSVSSALPAQVVPASPSFVLDRSVFVITVKKLDNIVGQIRIRPASSSSSDPNFIRELGQFCFQTPRMLSARTWQAVPEMFVVLPLSFTEEGFNQEPTEAERSTTSTFMNHPLDVGIIRWPGSDSTSSECWTLLIALDHFSESKIVHHIVSRTPAGHFGRVESGADVLAKLSGVQGSERASYHFTLKSV